MAILKCPACQGGLLQLPLHGRVSHVCPLRHGHALPVSVVRRWLTDEARPIFDRALSAGRPGQRPCPRCRLAMQAFQFGGALELDRCESCGLAWFDKGEQDLLPQREAGEFEAGEEEPQVEMQYGEGLSFMAGRSPIENVQGDSGSFPLFTVLLIVAFSLVSKLAWHHQFRGFIFDSEHPFAGAGIPALLSLFAHADINHLIGNIMFFFVPASLIESTFGEKVLLQLFFVAGFAGLVLQSMLAPHSLMLGASGGIAGIYTALCLTQPNAVQVSKDQRFGFHGFYTWTYRIPMWLMFVFWIGDQLSDYAYHPHDGIGYGSHFGGIIAGFAFVAVSDLKFLGPQIPKLATRKLT